jgi:hypothetical protein
LIAEGFLVCPAGNKLWGQIMDSTAPRTARLQAIRDRWFTEPLKTQFPPLADEALGPPPATCNELVQHVRLTSAFSSLAESHDTAGVSRDEAVAHDRAVNFQHFGVEEPKAVMQELSRQFDRGPAGQVDPETIKKGFVVLDTIRADSAELAAPTPPAGQASGDQGSAVKPEAALVRTAHLADAEAAAQAQGLVAELAAELGISLPVSQGVKRAK